MTAVLLSMCKMLAFGWLAVLFFSLAVLVRRSDVEIQIWSGSAWPAPWKAAAKAIQWRRQRTGERVLDRLVDFRRK